MSQSPKPSAGGNPLAYLFAKTWRYSEGNQGRVALFWTLFVLAECVEVFVNPLIWARLMDTVQTQGVTPESLRHTLWLLAALVATTVLFWALHGPARLMEQSNAFRAKLNYRKHLLLGSLNLSLDWHAENHSGATIDKIEKGTNGLYQFAESSFQIIYVTVKLVASYCMLAYFFPPSAAIVAVLMSITFLVVVRFDRVLVGMYRRLNTAENEIAATVFDSISNITTVIVLRVERLIFDSIVQKAEAPFALFRRSKLLNEIKWGLTALLGILTVAIVMGAYFWGNLGAAGGVLVGQVYLLYRYLNNITEILFDFASMYSDVVKRRAGVSNSEELGEQFTGESLSNHVLPKDWRELKIENLSFSYDGAGSRQHLDNVSLSIRRGEKIAVVGPSGGGKTTFLKTIRDLQHPTSLDLSVDGRVIPHGFDGISRAIALVPQKPEIFASTVWKNLTLGASYSRETVLRFADMARFTAVANELPHGFESSINEDGVNLSGGQQQRLALARGFIACQDKDIVLLDEPTSGLDRITEREITQNVFREFADKTVLWSVHGLHLLPHFDRVCMFEQGKIVGLGTLDELLASCPQFAALYGSGE